LQEAIVLPPKFGFVADPEFTDPSRTHADFQSPSWEVQRTLFRDLSGIPN
jgi:hypothetical protein